MFVYHIITQSHEIEMYFWNLKQATYSCFCVNSEPIWNDDLFIQITNIIFKWLSISWVHWKYILSCNLQINHKIKRKKNENWKIWNRENKIVNRKVTLQQIFLWISKIKIRLNQFSLNLRQNKIFSNVFLSKISMVFKIRKFNNFSEKLICFDFIVSQCRQNKEEKNAVWYKEGRTEVTSHNWIAPLLSSVRTCRRLFMIWCRMTPGRPTKQSKCCVRLNDWDEWVKRKFFVCLFWIFEMNQELFWKEWIERGSASMRKTREWIRWKR